MLEPVAHTKQLLARSLRYEGSPKNAVENMNANEHNAPAVEVNDSSFESEVLNSAQPVMVAFQAPWSRPCRILEQTLNEVAAACAGIAKIVRVNADDNPALSLWYDVHSIPTLLYFMDGNLRARIVGTATKEAILSKLESTRKAS